MVASLRSALLLVCAGLAVGCPDEQEDAPQPMASMPEPIVPEPSAVSSALAAMPSWAADLPEQVPPLQPGQRVWAAPPQPGSELVEVGIYTVEGVHDDRISLTDRLTQRIDGVPGAVVHAARGGAKLSEGDIVLCCGFTVSAMIGRVGKLSAGREIQVHYDWGGTTKGASIEHCEPPVAGIRPLAFVGFPKGGSTSRGLIVALDEKRAWIRTASGHVEIHPLGELETLPMPRADHKAGARVRAYSWATGFQPGVISEVVEPGLRYRVKLDGNKPSRDYFFSMLLDAG